MLITCDVCQFRIWSQKVPNKVQYEFVGILLLVNARGGTSRKISGRVSGTEAEFRTGSGSGNYDA